MSNYSELHQHLRNAWVQVRGKPEVVYALKEKLKESVAHLKDREDKKWDVYLENRVRVFLYELQYPEPE